MHMKGKNALLTGGSRGLGPFIAAALAEEGVNLVITARNQDALDAVATDLRKTGITVFAIACDINDAAGRQMLVDTANEKLGRIDFLINNAGIETAGAFEKHDPAEIDLTVTTNVTSPLHLAHMLLPDMLARESGHIVNIASLAGKQGSAYDAMYSGTKAALIEWTRGLRAELKGRGVSVSAIAPGYISEVGMFASFGVEAPKLLGTSSPETVAAAVVKAIKNDIFEIIINPIPVKPLLALNIFFPAVGDFFLKWTGINKVQKEKVGEA